MIPLAALSILKTVAGGVRKVLRAVPWWAWLAAGAFLAAILYGNARYDEGYAQARTEYEARMAEESEQHAQFLAEQEANHRWLQQQAQAEVIHAQDQEARHVKDAKDRAAATVAAIRADNFKLRDHWQRCLGQVSGAGQDADPASGDVGGADLRAADIGRVQGISGACAARVKRWQDSWKAAEQAVNAQSGG